MVNHQLSLCSLTKCWHCNNVCSEKKYTKCSSVLLLRLVYFFWEQTLQCLNPRSNTHTTNIFLDNFIQKWSLCLPGRLLKAAGGSSPWLAIRDKMVSLHKGWVNIRLVSIIICWSKALMLAVLLDISSKVLKAVTLAPKGTSRMHGCKTFSTRIFSTRIHQLLG